MRRVVPAWKVEPTDRLVEAGGKTFADSTTVMAVDTIGGMTYLQWPGRDPEHPCSLGLLNHEFVTVECAGRPRPLAALPAAAWKAMAVCAAATILAAVVAVLSVDPLYGWVWRAW